MEPTKHVSTDLGPNATQEDLLREMGKLGFGFEVVANDGYWCVMMRCDTPLTRTNFIIPPDLVKLLIGALDRLMHAADGLNQSRGQ